MIDNLKEFDVVYFSATFCGPCKVTKPIIEKISAEKNINTKIFTVDEEENGNKIASSFGVKSVPTIIFFKEGNEVGRNIGSINGDKFTELYNQFMN